MKLLLDTHVLIWAATDSPKLSAAARKALISPHHERFVSVASVWELATKTRVGKLSIEGDLRDFVNGRLVEFAASTLPVTLEHALRVRELPRHHGDPFDLILIAQSQVEDMTLITADARIEQYDVRVLW